MLLLGGRDIESLLEPGVTVGAVEAAMRELSRGEAVQPLRTVVDLPSARGSALFMPAVLPAADALGVKLVTIHPENRAIDLPTHHAAVLLCDAATGRPQALLEGASLTARRTAAVSALATRLLAPAEVRVLALVGTGVQARHHLPFLLAERSFERVRVWSPRADSRRRFVERLQPSTEVPIEAVPDAERAVRGADVVVTATSSPEPVLERSWIADGVHLNAIGASTATTREIDAATVASARLFVDHRQAAFAEAGELLLAIEEGAIGADHVEAELGEVAAGSHPGRRTADEITLFKSLGLAVQDLAVARLALERATERGAGREVAWE